MAHDPLASGAHALGAADAALLLAVGMATAALLAHTLRKVRSPDWLVGFGWAIGGAVAVGTGLWLLQLLAWGLADPASRLWFTPAPFIAAWISAAIGVAVALVISRWLPSHREVTPTLLVLLLPTLVVVFVVLGAALSHPPHWNRLATGPTLGALGVAAAGLGLALHLFNGPRQSWLPRASAQRDVRERER